MIKQRKVILSLTFIFTMFFSTVALAGPFTNPATTNSNYDRWDAKVYAERHAESPNDDEYADFMSSGGDCTNFVSQVLWAGGMSMNGTSTPGYGYWYYYGSVPPSRSYSWTGVTQFMQYWANYNGSGKNKAYSFKIYTLTDAMDPDTYHAIFKDLYEGDIIQYTGAITHSQVVHDYDSTDLYVAQHGTEEARYYSGQKLSQYLDWVLDGYGSNVTVYTERMKLAST
ncbi:amidase domain-containing protein [Desulfosporosinus hippei]|uniref:Putative amidase domain-containing protein n=1 Tax=Desulfosporosinus hippei DSM 8344 TaxID=1121419 RepID=A0A1G8H782_9FIRM|nr:amidase domain-containing protein [Desulfosporosinus hippei]SDI02465.1 Putative amidase domain-containing protein [Desulfosporosinus hippei DSM 8344]